MTKWLEEWLEEFKLLVPETIPAAPLPNQATLLVTYPALILIALIGLGTSLSSPCLSPQEGRGSLRE